MDPRLGRFISKDPLGFAAGDLNVLTYVGNNPINLVDPLGLWQVELGAAWGYGGKVRFGHDPKSGKWNFGVSAGIGAGASISLDPDESSPFENPGKDIEVGLEALGQARSGALSAGLTYDALVKGGGKCGNEYDVSVGLKGELSPGIEKACPELGAWGLEGRIGVKGQVGEVPMRGYGSIDGKRSFGLGGMVFAGAKANFWW